MELSAEINTSISNAVALLDNMSAGICALDHNYNYIAFNTAHQEVMRRSPGIEIKAGDYYPDTVINDPVIKDGALKIFSRVLNGENIQAITDFGDRGLYRARYNISYNPFRDAYGHIAGIIIISQDISEITGEQKENAEKTETLLALVNDIQDYSKLQSGKVVFEEFPFNLPLLIQSIKSSYDLPAKEKGIRFRIRRDVDVPDVVAGDPVRLSQVLNNLISNAVKFTNEGYVMIDISLNKSTSTHVYIDFSIKDTAIGIDASMKDYIFESFTRANADTTRLSAGTDLGLAITRQLLQLQHSNITFENIPGKGSVFSFSLAFKKGNETITPAVQNVVNNIQDIAGKKILLAEDNEINRIVATRFMQNWLLKIDYAVSGTEAVKKMKNSDYDLILMDLQMPGLDGYEASQQIRSFNGSIPIIALTASAMPEIKNKVKEAGMNDYITKPFVPDKLFDVLAHYLTA